MIRYLLDTNAWINLRENPARISSSIHKLLTAETQFAIPPIHLTEAHRPVGGRVASRPIFYRC